VHLVETVLIDVLVSFFTLVLRLAGDPSVGEGATLGLGGKLQQVWWQLSQLAGILHVDHINVSVVNEQNLELASANLMENLGTVPLTVSLALSGAKGSLQDWALELLTFAGVEVG